MADPTSDYHHLYRSDFFLWAQAVAQALRQDTLDAQARQLPGFSANNACVHVP
jgi:hypothetical protein